MNTAKGIGRTNALVALDNTGDFPTLAVSIAAYAENVVDTCREYGLAVDQAMDAFREVIVEDNGESEADWAVEPEMTNMEARRLLARADHSRRRAYKASAESCRAQADADECEGYVADAESRMELSTSDVNAAAQRAGIMFGLCFSRREAALEWEALSWAT